MSTSNGTKAEKYSYLHGFGTHFSSESLPGALPVGQNSPQICPYNLYCEQLSGTAFTVPRAANQRSWLYRILPSVYHQSFTAYTEKSGINNPVAAVPIPNQLRWKPLELSSVHKTDFINGIQCIAMAGDPNLKTGMAIHLYVANTSMDHKAFCNADGDFLIVPQEGTLDIQTEFGYLEVHPGEIAVIQRCIRFSVEVSGFCRGYIAEIYNGHFKLPDLGPIGANGLANPRDFQTPVAAFEDTSDEFRVVQKFSNNLFESKQKFSPFNVVAWHGNYAPYKYNLNHFNTVNTVSYDHLDPSIFTVLTCQSTEPGVAVCDFVIFPSFWLVAENTFRPPWFHRNCMSEFMGLVRGVYGAKPGSGFVPGGSSLHSCGTPHGPASAAFDKAITVKLEPFKPADTLAFMFESTYILKTTQYAQDSPKLDRDYTNDWADFRKLFDPTKK